MDVKKAYKLWSVQYDSDINKTRDLEAISLRETLHSVNFKTCLEIGCGTGKNTEWLVSTANEILAVDLSAEMIALAKQKLRSKKVKFVEADINGEWSFTKKKYDLIVFSLVLEHIKNLDHIFRNASKAVMPGGWMYIGELHPYKHYTGSKARFETKDGLHDVPCFTHHISDFTTSAETYGFEIAGLNEYFDETGRKSVPRILAILFKKQSAG